MHDQVLFELYRGDDFSLKVVVTDENDQAVDITGWSFKSTMKLDPRSPDNEAGFQSDIPALPADADSTNGVFYLTIPKEDSANLKVATYHYGLQREFEGSVVTVITGRVRVKQDITTRVG